MAGTEVADSAFTGTCRHLLTQRAVGHCYTMKAKKDGYTLYVSGIG